MAFSEKDLSNLKDYDQLVDRQLATGLQVEALKNSISDIELFKQSVFARYEKEGGDFTEIVADEIINQSKNELINREAEILKAIYDEGLFKDEKSPISLDVLFHRPSHWATIVLQVYHEMAGYKDDDYIIFSVPKVTLDQVNDLNKKLKRAFTGKRILIIGSGDAAEYFYEFGAEPFSVTISKERSNATRDKRTDEQNKYLDEHFLGSMDVRKFIYSEADEDSKITEFRNNVKSGQVDVLISFQVFSSLYFKGDEGTEIIEKFKEEYLKPNGVEFHDRTQ